jgi:F-type H+-transporting ATPase subunit epsilon
VAATFELQIATPEQLLVREQVTEAMIPAENGYIGVLPDHAPLFAQLGINPLTWTGGQSGHAVMMVAQGFIEIHDNCVRVLADEAQMASEIDLAAAEKELAEATDQLSKPADAEGTKDVLIRYRKAQARVEAARKARA